MLKKNVFIKENNKKPVEFSYYQCKFVISD